MASIFRRRHIATVLVLSVASILGTQFLARVGVCFATGLPGTSEIIIFVMLRLMHTVLTAALANKGSTKPSVAEYYTNFESQLGYWLLLGNARHCGLWDKDTVWPFPISKAQRAMEEKLYTRLGLVNGSKVLDAGAGSGIIAVYMAERGLQVKAIDLTPTHVAQGKRNVKNRGLEDHVSVELGDYHDLSNIPDNSLDGVYMMETFVHADDPLKVLQILDEY